MSSPWEPVGDCKIQKIWPDELFCQMTSATGFGLLSLWHREPNTLEYCLWNFLSVKNEANVHWWLISCFPIFLASYLSTVHHGCKIDLLATATTFMRLLEILFARSFRYISNTPIHIFKKFHFE